MVYLAQDKGYFTENGLKVTLKEYPSGKQSADAMMSGQADLATAADFVLVSDSFERDDMVTVGTVSTARTIDLISRTDRGIDSLRDLAGKRVGVLQRSVAEYFLGSLAAFGGISIDEIEIVDLAPPDNEDAIITGDIDAAIVWDPFAYRIRESLGDETRTFSTGFQQQYYFMLVSQRSWVENHPTTIKLLLQSILQAENFALEHEEESKLILKERFGFSSDYIEHVWGRHDFKMSLPQALILQFEEQARWRIENSLTQSEIVPNFTEYIIYEPLESVNSSAVTIIR